MSRLSKLADEAINEMKEPPRSASTPRRKKPVPTHSPTNGSTPARILIEVDWQHIPMDEARVLYAQLKKAFEHAGFILNERVMPPPIARYACFMCPCTCKTPSKSVNPIDHEPGCKKVHEGEARGKDDSYKDKSGLYIPVRICGERHWWEFQQILIKERREKNLREEA